MVRRRGLVQAEARVRGVAVARVCRAVRRRVRGGALALLYAYQLPELTATANAVRAQWLGLYVLGGGEGWVNFFECAQAASVAGLFWCLCAAGALRPTRRDADTDVDETESEMSETPRSARSGRRGEADRNILVVQDRKSVV